MNTSLQRDDLPPDDRPAAERGPTAHVGPERSRFRSFTFLERSGERWTVFLVTFPDADGLWRGYFTFRSASGGPDSPEIRTANLFVESSEPEIDVRARGLGRPLVLALLESALDTVERRRSESPDTQRWFREMLTAYAADRLPDLGELPEDLSLSHLRSLYDSYRVDQVAHLIALMKPEDFRELVDAVLDGRSIDFRARDRLQLSMLVVQEIERRLPLPPFETWLEDFLTHREEYQVYSYALHREGRLP